MPTTEKNGQRNPAQVPLASEPKTVTFEDVFQGGNAKEKYIIVAWPKDTNNWFILRCERHRQLFGRHTLLGGSRHLQTEAHGSHKIKKDYDLAVTKFGVRVLNCDANKAKLNNKAYIVWEDSKRPKVTPAKRKLHTRSSGSRKSQKREEQPSGDNLITNAMPGEVYGVWWKSERKWYAAVILSTGDFAEIGISGSLRKTGLINQIPPCYQIAEDQTQEILGWKEGFEDGGSFTEKRRFPALFFDDGMEVPTLGRFKIPKGEYLSWIYAHDIKRLEDLTSHKVRGLKAASDYGDRMKQIRMLKPVVQKEQREQHQQEEQEEGEEEEEEEEEEEYDEDDEDDDDEEDDEEGDEDAEEGDEEEEEEEEQEEQHPENAPSDGGNGLNNCKIPRQVKQAIAFCNRY